MNTMVEKEDFKKYGLIGTFKLRISSLPKDI